MKRFAWLLLALPLLASCAGKTGGDDLAALKKAGKIVLGTSADYPPYEFHRLDQGADSIVGFDIAIANEIAGKLGVKLEIKDMKFDGLLAALDSGNVDFVLAGMTPTEERKKSVDFTRVYYRADQGILLRKADLGKYASLESLKGAMIGAQKGAIQAGIAKKRIKGLENDKAEHREVKELGKVADLVLELKNGKIEAVVVEKNVAAAYAKRNPDLAVAELGFPDEEGGSAAAVKKGRPALLAALDAALGAVVDSGAVESFVAEATLLAESE